MPYLYHNKHQKSFCGHKRTGELCEPTMGRCPRIKSPRVLNCLMQKRGIFCQISQCLKITENISFNIASEASYVYILSGQKLNKNAKNGPFGRVVENLKLVVK